MTFPNHPRLKADHPHFFHSVSGKKNVYVANQFPTCEVLVLALHCPDCQGPPGASIESFDYHAASRTYVYHALCGNECPHHGGGPNLKDRRAVHETCKHCGKRMVEVPMAKLHDWPMTAFEKGNGD